MMILASAVLAGSLLATGAQARGGGGGGGHGGGGGGHMGAALAAAIWVGLAEVTSAASAELTSAALVALTSAALAQVAWRMSATSTSASDGADLAAAFTTTASIAHITGLIPGRIPAPTECQANAEGADRRTSQP